jgi:hypothetical protein
LRGFERYGGNAVLSSPAVVNGVVYVGSDDGSVYAFGLISGDWVKQQQTSDRPDLKMLRPDFHLKVSKPVATPSGAD